MSNLNQLNEILFDTLQQVKSDTMQLEKAKSMVEVSNAIISNAKVQLHAIKLMDKMRPQDRPEIFGLPEETKQISESERAEKERRRKQAEKNRYDAMESFANEKGYKNVADGIGKMTKTVFMAEFEKWLKAEN